MELASLGIGIASLAGLFTSCVDAAERVSSYRSYGNDSHDLEAQFAADRLRFTQWGRHVGFRGHVLSPSHHPALDDKDTNRAVSDLLTTIERHLQGFNDTRQPNSVANASGFRGHRNPAASMRYKMSWALWNKKERIQQVGQFGIFVQKLLEIVPLEVDEFKTSFQAHSDLWLDELRQITTKLEDQMHSEMKKELHSWILGHHNLAEIYEDATQDRLDGTCNWIFSNECFQSWDRREQSVSNTLWINGPAGFGKTFLCARLAQYLLEEPDSSVAHFFFSANFDSREDPTVAIRSWLSQIISHHEGALDLVRQEFDAEETKQAKKASLVKLLQQVLQRVPNCTLVVDGLDECTPRRQVTNFLNTVQGATLGTSARLLVVSRDVTDVRFGFTHGFAEVKTTREDVQSDILRYSQSIIDRQLSNKSTAIRDDVTTRMADRCEGQFLWLKLQATSLKKSFNQKQLQMSIKEAPVGLEHLYERDWFEIQRTNKRDKGRAMSLLRWAAFALRPLTVGEIVEAVLLDVDSDEFPEDELPDCIDQDYVNEEILGLCGSLLEVRHTSSGANVSRNTVQLGHFTVKEFLLQTLPIPATRATLQDSRQASENMRLATLCLLYTTYPRTWQANVESSPARLQHYAADAWYLHYGLGRCEESPYDTRLLDLTMGLFDETHPSWHPWRKWFSRRVGARELAAEPLPSNPLYYASHLDLRDTASSIIREAKASVHEKSRLGRHALTIAALCGHTSMIEILLDAGSSVDVTDSFGNTPLHVAAEQGHIEVVKQLLEHGADITAANDDSMTPLYLASWKGYIEVVKLLLDEAAGITMPTKGGWVPVSAAASMGHVEVVKLLIEHGADIAVANVGGWITLHIASCNGHVEVVKLLLDKGADLTVPTKDGWVPVSAAASMGHVEVVKLLIEHGADIAVATVDGCTALDIASYDGSVEVVKLLIKHGADITVADVDGYTSLHLAAEQNHVEVMKLLIKHGADIAVANVNGSTPLHLAAKQGQVEAVKLLIEHGADIAAANVDGNLSLHLAAEQGHVEVMKLLIEQGANIAVANVIGYTSIQLGAKQGHVEAVKLLIEHGADITAASSSGEGSIHLAAHAGHVKIVEILSEKLNNICGSADLVVDSLGRTPMFVAARRGHLDVVQVLLKAFPTMFKTMDWCRSTPFFAAVRNGHCKTAEFFLKGNPDLLDHKDSSGRTASSWASRNNDNPMYSLLSYYAEIAGVKLAGQPPSEDIKSPESKQQGRRFGYCDGCTLDISVNSKYHGCPHCYGGRLVLCVDCFDGGVTCLDSSHTMELRTAAS